MFQLPVAAIILRLKNRLTFELFHPPLQNVEVDFEYLEHIYNDVWKNLNFTELKFTYRGDVEFIYYDEFFECIDDHLYKDFKSLKMGEKTSRYCNASFDGYRCWPRTESNTTAFRECPLHTKAENSKF